MGRFLFLLAILLLVASIGLLIVLVSGAENEWANQIFSSVLCAEDEKFTQWFGSYVPRSGSSSGGRETAFYCEDDDGNERDVTLNAVAMMIGGFAIPFIASLILFFVAGAVMVNQRMKKATQNIFDLSGGSAAWTAMTQGQSTMQVIDLRDGSYQGGEIPPEKMAQVQQILSSFGLQNLSSTGGNTLTERLKQLEDARQQGLISQSEYERLRQSILDNVDN